MAQLVRAPVFSKLKVAGSNYTAVHWPLEFVWPPCVLWPSYKRRANCHINCNLAFEAQKLNCPFFRMQWVTETCDFNQLYFRWKRWVRGIFLWILDVRVTHTYYNAISVTCVCFLLQIPLRLKWALDKYPKVRQVSIQNIKLQLIHFLLFVKDWSLSVSSCHNKSAF